MATNDTQRGESTLETPAPPVDEPDEHGGAQGAEQDEPKTYDEAYVTKLRDEAAANRVRGKRVEEAEKRLRALATEAAARGVLQDPTDLPWSEDYVDDDGWPDHDKIRAAAEDLATRKPHLGRPAGDVGQGRHSDEEDNGTLVGLLKAGV